ncbi:Tetratricopeptide (TPR) repeat [Methanophagales archaeon]|nr:Tetratricopeptide (TPR) repeat [Methanophagales archaeon]
MNTRNHGKVQVSYGPCPPEEFAGRFTERTELTDIMPLAIPQGQTILISGARGSGKTSFLDWAEYEIQNKPGGLESPAIKVDFLETPGMIFTSYMVLLTELLGHRKFGWFKKALGNSKVKRSIDVLLGILENASPLAGPAGAGIKAGAAATRGLLSGEAVDYSPLLSAFLTTLRSLSGELKNNQILTLLCDDVQWSSEPDFHLLKDLIRNLPPRIVFVISFRLEAESIAKYIELRQELDRFGYTEIRLSGMRADEINDFAMLRYDLSIDDLAADFLTMNLDDPLCLVSCFNILQRSDRDPNLENVQEILPDALDPARAIYSGLDQKWKDRANYLCVLHPPLPLSLIACMLKIENAEITKLQDELNQSVVFRRLERETYDFAHHSLREYRRNELPESVMIQSHVQAACCFEVMGDTAPDKWLVGISLAEHLFLGQEYEKALELNLRLGDLLYDRFDYDSALQLTERAKTCAEKTNDKNMLASALHQKGMILQSIYKFPDSLFAYNKSLEIAQELGNRAGEAATLHQIGIVYQLTNRFEEALENYNKSLEIKREVGNKSGEAISVETIKALKEKMQKKKDKTS